MSGDANRIGKNVSVLRAAQLLSLAVGLIVALALAGTPAARPASAAQLVGATLWVEPVVAGRAGDRILGPVTVYVDAPGAAQVTVFQWPVDAPIAGRRIGQPSVLGFADYAADTYSFAWDAEGPHPYVELFAIAVGPPLAGQLAFSEPVAFILDRQQSEGSAGSISGELGYPSEGIPPLIVYAIRVDRDEFTYGIVRTEVNQQTFAIEGLAPGVYVVVAYLAGGGSFAGGYTEAVACGLVVGCDDHTLIPVTVRSGEITGGVQVRDWYAPPGTFPAPPGPLP